MKTRLPLLALLVLAAASSLAAASESNPAAAHPVGAVERTGRIVVERGASSFEVQLELGAPARKLGDEVWIYHNFGAGSEQRPDDDCSNLVVIFTKDRVSDLKLVNDQAVAVFARQMEAPKNASLVASAPTVK